MPKHMLRSGCITEIGDDGTESCQMISDNRLPRIFVSLKKNTVKVILSELESWGGEKINFFACDVTGIQNR